jgi:pimeloyl-ACP methyl ester carboxylesterase
MTEGRVDRIEIGGRTVGVHMLAEAPGRTVVFAHAAPGSGAFDPDPSETERRGITLLAPDRPGYGHSDPPAAGSWATVDRAADDIAEILRRRGVQQASLCGWSAGGRIVLALAARHPDMVERVGVVATPAPNDQVPWIPPEINAGVEALRGEPAEVAHAALAGQMAPMVPADPRAPDAIGLVGGSPADQSVLETAGVRDSLGEMLADAFRQGGAGMVADVAGYTLQPWGFEPGDVRAKTLLLYGRNDPAIGPAHGSWWQRQLPDARLETAPDLGHLLIVPMWKRVLSFLAPSR